MVLPEQGDGSAQRHAGIADDGIFCHYVFYEHGDHLGQHPGRDEPVGFFQPAHQVHVLDRLTTRALDKVINCRYHHNPVAFRFHHDIAEVAPPHGSKRGFLVPDKVFVPVVVMVDLLGLLLVQGFVEKDMGSGEDSAVHGDKVGGEVAFRC